jgi:hypothetical protein
MSSVAVLTPDSFAEHRSGIKDQEMTGTLLVWDQWIEFYLLTLIGVAYKRMHPVFRDTSFFSQASLSA